MSRRHATLAGMMLAASTATASSMFAKRDSWGPAFSLGASKSPIISTTTTIYPGAMPADQTGYLFVWLGISNGTGDLIQSVIGSYPPGGSECGGQAAADTAWCVSSEVYGVADNGYPKQWVGDLTTADANYANGIKLNYTLVDPDTYLWSQTMTDAVTGELLSSYEKTSGPMLGWGTAIECNDYNGNACVGTVSDQTWVDSTIILESADASFIDTLGAGTGVTNSDMVTADNGKTWTIAKITIPAMQEGATADGTTADSSDAASASSAPTTAAAAQSTSTKKSSKSSSTKKSKATKAAAVDDSTSSASGVAQPTGSFGGFGGQEPGSSSGTQPTGSYGGWGSFGGQTSGTAAGARPTGYGHGGNHGFGRREMTLGRRIL